MGLIEELGIFVKSKLKIERKLVQIGKELNNHKLGYILYDKTVT
jgi:hypothetical protein